MKKPYITICLLFSFTNQLTCYKQSIQHHIRFFRNSKESKIIYFPSCFSNVGYLSILFARKHAFYFSQGFYQDLTPVVITNTITVFKKGAIQEKRREQWVNEQTHTEFVTNSTDREK